MIWHGRLGCGGYRTWRILEALDLGGCEFGDASRVSIRGVGPSGVDVEGSQLGSYGVSEKGRALLLSACGWTRSSMCK